ncbi:hypothetical protein Aeroheme_03186 [Aeromonas sp. DSM 116730]
MNPEPSCESMTDHRFTDVSLDTQESPHES